MGLPDRSLIQYSYDPVNLNAVVGNSQTQRYHCDLAGKVINETLFNGEIVAYAYDRKAQPLRIDCTHFAQTFAYSPVGNLLAYTKGTPAHTYRYDPLYQLTAEEGPACTPTATTPS